MVGNFLDGMFGKIAPDMCKLSVNGDIAIKTSSGYKTFDVASGTLTNCDNFVFSMGGMDAFFLIPTNKVIKGDIIIVNGKPKCVTKVDKTQITCINFEEGTVETIIPEKHVFMGDTYFYGKIVSMFGNLKKGGSNKIFKYMMLSEMMKNTSSNSNNSMSAMLPFMLMNSGTSNIFGEMFDLDTDVDNKEDAE